MRTRKARLEMARVRGRHTQDQWIALCFGCRDRCVRCGKAGKVVMDHIVPLYQAGRFPSDGIENIQPLCHRCNSSKGPEFIDHRPSDWREGYRIMLEELGRA